jgi:hypothetical protein
MPGQANGGFQESMKLLLYLSESGKAFSVMKDALTKSNNGVMQKGE